MVLCCVTLLVTSATVILIFDFCDLLAWRPSCFQVAFKLLSSYLETKLLSSNLVDQVTCQVTWQVFLLCGGGRRRGLLRQKQSRKSAS
jgi:hypothetical protein